VKNYINLINKILIEGEPTNDRTGVGTTSIFGTRLEWDLRRGFPAVTTKTLAWKSVVSELMWFLSGSSNIEDLRERRYGKGNEGATIWDANYENQGKALGYSDGELGPVYGNQFRVSPYKPTTEVIEIPIRTFREKNVDTPKLELQTPEKGFGEIFNTNNFGKVITLSKVSEVGAKNSIYKCQFLNTGSIRDLSRPNLRSGTAKDNTQSQSRMDILKDCDVPEKLYNLWYNMCSRCLDPLAVSYEHYGGSGTKIQQSWKVLSNFSKDISSVPGYYNWLHEPGYEIDKDYFGANTYSASTTIFLESSYNKNLAKVRGNTCYKVTYNKRTELILFLKPFCKEHNLPAETVRCSIKDKLYWSNEEVKIELVNSSKGKLFRYKMYTDQIQQLIDSVKEGVSTGVHSRRNMVTAWNVSDLDKMALPPCHHTFQVHVNSKKELSLMWHQRSIDVFLGMPFNIASYALLTHILAKITGCTVGKLIFTGGDTHIYKNHYNAVSELVTRTPLRLPELELPEYDNLDSYLEDDISSFKLIGYTSGGALTAPMAV